MAGGVNYKRFVVIIDHLNTSVVREWGQLESIRGEWDALWSCCSDSTPFQSYTWVKTWWGYFGQGSDLFVVLVRENGRLVGIGPFVLRRRMGVPTIEVLGANQAGYFGLVVEAARVDVVEAIAAEVDSRTRIGLIHLPFAGVGDSAWCTLQAALATQGWGNASWIRNISHRVWCEGNFERYLSRKSGKTRQTLRRERKKLQELGEVSFEVYERDKVDDSVHRRICELQKRSRLSRRGQESLASPHWRDYVLNMAAAGMVDVFILTINKEDAAYLLNYRHRGITYALRTGFDEKWSAISVGKVMWSMSLETVFNRGDHLLDFMFGDGEYKQFWGNRTGYIMRSTLWRGARGYVLSWFPHRLHGFVTRHEALRDTLKGLARKFRNMVRKGPATESHKSAPTAGAATDYPNSAAPCDLPGAAKAPAGDQGPGAGVA